MKNHTGFTLLELTIVLLILGIVAGAVAYSGGRSGERAAVITTLAEMSEIKKAIRGEGGYGFYPDIGLIPEDSINPEYATRYLCLKDDGAGGSQHVEMHDLLVARLGSAEAGRLIEWDKYNRKGWRGPYMEPDKKYDAGGNKYFPLLSDAWGNYYRIEMDTPQDKDSARIVSFGANSKDNGGTILPVPADIGDDIVMFVFGGGETRSPLD